MPLRVAQRNRNYPVIVLGMRPQLVLRQLQPYAAKFIWATPSYVDSALLMFFSGRYCPVFGGGSHHGRQDDILTDYRSLDGADLLVFWKSPPRPEEYAPYFARVQVKIVPVDGAVYYLVLGYGFRYENYRDDVLEHIQETYYAIPPYLPVGSCYFREKYFK
jgi:hypothetical protein